MDYTTSQSVPFKIPDINHGFQVAEGLLKLTENGIELEFEIKDAILGVINSGVKTVTLDYEELKDIRFKKGWFSAKVFLEGNSMRVFEKLPRSEQAVCVLKIKRKDREDARNIVSRAKVYLSEQKLSRLDEG